MQASLESFLPNVDHQELQQILFSYFGQVFAPQDRTYRYQREGVDHCLFLRCDKNGSIAHIVPSSDFPHHKIAEICALVHETLVVNQCPVIGQTIGFCSAPVRGYYRYQDLFQILPVPDTAPRPGFTINDHPFLIQYSFRSCPDGLLNFSREMREQSTVSGLLNLFSPARIWSKARRAEFQWVYLPDSDGDRTSVYAQKEYLYPGLRFNVEGFTDVADLERMDTESFGQYYPRWFPGIPLALPNSLSRSLDLVFSLQPDDRRKFDMAMAWYSQAGELWQSSRSASFVALVSALECLMEKGGQCPTCNQTPTEGLEKCPSCGQPRYRVTRSFRSFLHEHVPGIEQYSRETGLLYATRSELVHGLKLMDWDLQPWKSMHSLDREQDELHRKLRQLTRIAEHNWLRRRHR